MKTKKPIKVAITGGIGSGKSTLSDFFEDKGFYVIKADPLAKELLVKNPTVKKQIKNHFGKDIYNKDGSLNRALLAERSFKNKADDKNFVEAALIFEAKMETLFDYIVLVTADEQIRIKRTQKRDKSAIEDIKSRMQNQIPDEKKKSKSDFVFENNGTKKALIQKAKMLLKIIETHS